MRNLLFVFLMVLSVEGFAQFEKRKSPLFQKVGIAIGYGTSGVDNNLNFQLNYQVKLSRKTNNIFLKTGLHSYNYEKTRTVKNYTTPAYYEINRYKINTRSFSIPLLLSLQTNNRLKFIFDIGAIYNIYNIVEKKHLQDKQNVKGFDSAYKLSYGLQSAFGPEYYLNKKNSISLKFNIVGSKYNQDLAGVNAGFFLEYSYLLN
jgi:hypothetical protein